MKVLVIEDDREAAAYIVKGLGESGYVVEHADKGATGCSWPRARATTRIILDRMLPGGIDGLAIIAALRAADNPTPVLILQRPRRGRRPGPRPEGRRRRLPDASPSPSPSCWRASRRCCAAPGRPPRHDQARSGDLEMDLLARQVTRAGQQDRPAAARVPPAGIPDAPRRPGGDPHHAAGERLGLPLRPADQRHRRARQPAAPEDRQARSTGRCSTPCAAPATGLPRNSTVRRYFKTNAVRLAALYLVLFATSVLALWCSSISRQPILPRARPRRHSTPNPAAWPSSTTSAGWPGSSKIIADRSTGGHPERTLYLITDPLLHRLAGNLSQWPKTTPIRPGWVEFPVEEVTHGVYPVAHRARLGIRAARRLSAAGRPRHARRRHVPRPHHSHARRGRRS